MSKAFTPGRVSGLEGRIRDYQPRAAGPAGRRPGFDYLEDFGTQLPSLVISSLLGVSPGDRPQVLELINTVSTSSRASAWSTMCRSGHRSGCIEYLTEQLADRRRAPKDDMITALTEAEITEDGKVRRLSDKEAADFANLLVSAGTETVARLLGWAAVILADHPRSAGRDGRRPGLLPEAVEELLRYEAPSPVQGRTLRGRWSCTAKRSGGSQGAAAHRGGRPGRAGVP